MEKFPHQHSAGSQRTHLYRAVLAGSGQLTDAGSRYYIIWILAVSKADRFYGV